jgi:hypothetical protein
VKCDETLPACNRCRRHDRKCSLSEIFETSPNSFVAVAAASPRTLPTRLELNSPQLDNEAVESRKIVPFSENTNAIQSASPERRSKHNGFDKARPSCEDGTPILSVQSTQHDGRLLARYIDVTANSMNDHEELRPLFRDAAPRLASTRPHLMYCILAIAGLDELIRDSTASRSTHETNALQNLVLDYRSRSLRLFQEELNTSSTTDDCMAAALAGILILFASMAFHQLADKNSPTPVDKAAEILRLLAGVGAFFESRRSEIATSAAGILMVFYSLPDPSIVLADDVQASLCGLQDLCAAEHLTPGMRMFFSTMIDGLYECFRATAQRPREVGHRLRWIIPPHAQKLAEVLDAKCPEALLIVAHWAADFADWPGAWWAARLGRDIVEEVEQILEPHLKQYLQWPLKQIGKYA